MKLILTAVCICLLACSPCSAQAEDDYYWIDKHYPTALDNLFPIVQEEGLNIGYRSHHSLLQDVLEYEFLISKDISTNKVTAVVRMADSFSLYKQLMALHQKNPSKTYEEVKSQIKIREWHFTEAECPYIRSLFDSFGRVHFRAPRLDWLIMDPMVYEIRTNGLSGDLRIESYTNKNDLVKWALKTRVKLERCREKGRVLNQS